MQDRGSERLKRVAVAYLSRVAGRKKTGAQVPQRKKKETESGRTDSTVFFFLSFHLSIPRADGFTSVCQRVADDVLKAAVKG